MAAAAGPGAGSGAGRAAARARPGPARFRGCLAGALLGDCLGAVFEGRSVVKLPDLLSFLRGLEPAAGPAEEGEAAGSARRGGEPREPRERDGGLARSTSRSLHSPPPKPLQIRPQRPQDRALGCVSPPSLLPQAWCPPPCPSPRPGHLPGDTRAAPAPLCRVPFAAGLSPSSGSPGLFLFP